MGDADGCGHGPRGASVRGTEPAGRSVIPVDNGTGPGGADTRKLRTIAAVASVASSTEKYWPMHARGPPPKGM